MMSLPLPDGRPWGDAATPWQHGNARAFLEPGDGPRRFWTGAPRGFSKTEDGAGYLLAELVTGEIPPSHPAYCAASDRVQAAIVVDSIGGFVERGGLRAVVEVQNFRAVNRHTGASVEVVSSDASSAYGRRPSRLVVDELAQWSDNAGTRRYFEALWSSLPKVAGSKGLIITTAGSPSHFSYSTYQQALKEQERGLWRVSDIHAPAPWISSELIEAERRRLSDSAFLRLWRNQWSEAEDSLVSTSDLEAALREDDSPLAPVEGVSYVTAVDVGTVNDRTIVAVGHKEVTGEVERVVVDRLFKWQGTRRRAVDLDAVEAQIVEANIRYSGPVILDPHQAVQVKQRLTKRGIAAEQFDFTTQSVGKLASTLLVLLRSRRLSLPNDPLLVAELSAVRIVENSAGVARLQHDSGKHDDMAVACALLSWRLTDGAPVPHRSAKLRFYGSEPRAPLAAPVSVGWPARWPGGWS
jgi:Phage Terminase